MTKRYGILCTVALLACLSLSVSAVRQAQAAEGSTKVANIRKLLELQGGLQEIKRNMREIMGAFRQMAPQIPSTVLDSLEKEISDKELQALTDKIVVVYDKRFTDQEIQDILTFYESPSGKKVARMLPQLMDESRRIGIQWGEDLSRRVANRQSGLAGAASASKSDVAKELLAEGADVNARDAQGVTPLMVAAFKGNRDLAGILLDKGAEINARTDTGITSLMAAVQSGNKDLVRLLLAKGADVNAKQDQGLNAYQLASAMGKPELVTLLRDKTKDKRPATTAVTVASVPDGTDCLPVSSFPHASAKRVDCVKLGHAVDITSTATNDGWLLIRKPTMGWVHTEALKSVILLAEEVQEKLGSNQPGGRSAGPHSEDAEKSKTEKPTQKTPGVPTPRFFPTISGPSLGR
jgi:hypothetical protein